MTDTMDRDAFLARLRGEYVESARDRLERLDELLDRLHMGTDVETDLMEMQREVHSMKGSAGTYGFPAISAIAHRMEDFIETSPTLDRSALGALQAFVDAIRAIVAAEADPGEGELANVLADLPSSAQPDPPTAGFSAQTVREIHVLLTMPRDIQRKIIGTELASCGFRVAMAETGADAIAHALAEPPNILLTAMELPDMSGAELTRVFHAVNRLQHCRMIVLTSYAREAPKIRALPSDIAVVRKGEMFIEDLSHCLLAWRILS